MKVRGVDHVAISVSDLERSLKFYTEVLGLKVSEREYQKPGVEYFIDCGTSLIGLIQGDPKGEKHLLQDSGLGGNHFSFRVDTKDFDKAACADAGLHRSQRDKAVGDFHHGGLASG